MKKNYQTPQTEVIQLEGEGLMWTLAASGASENPR